MSNTSSSNAHKKLVKIDVTSDSVCPWCFVGKRNLDKAIASSQHKYDFEIKWHPYQLLPDAPKEGVDRREFSRRKFGSHSAQMEDGMAEVFGKLGLEYSKSGLTGNTMDSHRLVYFAGQQGSDKQHRLVEEMFLGYFTQGKFIGDHDFLVECAKKVNIEGAAEFLRDPNNGLREVKNELHSNSGNLRGVPFYVINGSYKVNGAQPPELFLKAFEQV